MDDRIETQALAVEAAQQLLQHFRESNPGWADDKIPLEPLADWLGLKIATFHPDDYPIGTYGFLDAGENLIWIQRDLAEGMHRFTLAHEIGHAILHHQVGRQHISFRLAPSVVVVEPGTSREDLCKEYDVREDITDLVFQEQTDELLGIGVSYDPRSQREVAANFFAAELLIPLERVRALYLTGEIPADELAKTFGVSKSAMLNRLSVLLSQHEAKVYRRGIHGRSAGGDGIELQDGLPGDAHSSTKIISSPKKQYDEFQQAAIEASTPALIIAGPGTGKTSTLIGRVKYLMDTLCIAPENILALTFSRKAAREMQERLKSVLDEDETAFPTVSTFHAFCAELLRIYGDLVGLRQDFALIGESESYFLLLRLANELPLRHYQNLNTPTYYFPAILNGISRAKDELVTPAAYKSLALRMLEDAANDDEIESAEKALEVADIYALYQAALERQGNTDFGGLIMLTVQLLQKHPEVCHELQQKYQHILVDEFQDMNRASGVLLRELARDTGRVWVVGDANQAIYGFRGASPANIANFHNDFAGAVVLPLRRNYRSRPDIVNFADAFRRKQLDSNNILDTLQTARSDATDTYVTLAVASDEMSELNGFISDIQRKQTEGYHFRDIVVLCRTRAQVRKISQALIAAGLPVIERGGMLEEEHIRNLLSIFMLLADVSGMGLLRAARQPEHPLTQSDIEALLLEASQKADPEQKVAPISLILRDKVPIAMTRDGHRSLTRLASILKSLHHVQSIWLLLADYLFIETVLVRNLLVNTENMQIQAMLADYNEFLQTARSYDQQQQMLRFLQEQEAFAQGEVIVPVELPPIQEQARGFLDYLSVLLTLHQDGGHRDENTEDTVEEIPDVIRVMTVHASKGLEFPVVYLPGIVKQRFPIQKRSKPVEPPTAMFADGSESDAAHETGEACLFYVGATRARDHLVLSYAERYGKKNYKRSAYIDALVTGLPEERIRRVVWKNARDDGEGHAGESSRVDTLLVVDGRAAASPIPTFDVGNTDPDELTTWLKPFSSQPGDDFIEAMKPDKLTLSALETYMHCPRQYMYSTIYGFHGKKSAYAAFWRATHDTMDALKQKLETNRRIENWDGELLTEEESQELYSQRWQQEQGHTLPFAALYERHGHEVTELMRRKLLAIGETNWQLRQKLSVDIAGRTIEVGIDRIEAPLKNGEPIKFVRTRFGKRKEKPSATTREMLYARASLQHHTERTIELQLHNMSTGETYPITLSNKKEQSLYNELEEAILGMERNEFPPKPDVIKCPGCPFFLMCPA